MGTVYLTATDISASVTPDGVHWTNDLSASAPGASSISNTVSNTGTPPAELEYAYFQNVNGVIGTGTFTVEVVVATADADAGLSIQLHRVNSAGAIQASSSLSSEQALSADRTYTFTSLDLGTFAADDDLRVDFSQIGNGAHGNATFAYSIGSTGTRVVYPDAPSDVTLAANSGAGQSGQASALSVDRPLAGTTDGQSGQASALGVDRPLVSSSAGASANAAALLLNKMLAASSAGASANVADLLLDLALAASSDGTSAQVSALALDLALAASSAGQSAQVSALALDLVLAASSAGQSAQASDITVTVGGVDVTLASSNGNGQSGQASALSVDRLLASSSVGQSANGVPDSSLVAHYTFDDANTSGGVLADQGPNGYDATLTSSPTTGVTGQVDEAYTFGSFACLVVGNVANLNFDTGDARTFSVWVNSSGTGEMAFVAKYQLFTPGWQFGWNSGKPELKILNGSSAGYHAQTTTATVNNSVWRHVAITYDGVDANGITIYVDGSSVAATVVDNTAPGTTSNTTEVRIAQRYLNAARYSGSMDELYVFDRELSASEVQAIYNSGNAGNRASLGGAPLSLDLVLAAASAGQGAQVSDLTLDLVLAAASAGQSAQVSDLSILGTILLAAASAGQSADAADLTLDLVLAALSAGQSADAALLRLDLPVVASSAGQSADAADVALDLALAATSDGASANAASFALDLALAATSAGQSAQASDLGVLGVVLIAAASAGQSAQASDLVRELALAATSDGQSAQASDLVLDLVLAALSAGQSAQASDLTTTAEVLLEAASAGQSAQAALLGVALALAATSDGQSANAANAVLDLGLAATSDGQSAQTSDLVRELALAAASAGQSAQVSDFVRNLVLAASSAGVGAQTSALTAALPLPFVPSPTSGSIASTTTALAVQVVAGTLAVLRGAGSSVVLSAPYLLQSEVAATASPGASLTVDTP